MSKEEQVKQLTDYMAKFIAYTAKKLPDDVIAKLQELRDKEDSPLSKTIYNTMFENQKLAVELNRQHLWFRYAFQYRKQSGLTRVPYLWLA